MHQQAIMGVENKPAFPHHLIADQELPALPYFQYHTPQPNMHLNYQRLFSNIPRSSFPSPLWLPHELSSPSEASSLTGGGIVGFNVDDDTKHEDQMEELDMAVCERRERRLVSNRESARRSRMRKRKQLEELQGQVLQLLAANHQLTEKLNHVLECNYRVLQESSQLKEDNSSLRMVVADLMSHHHIHDSDHQVGQQAVGGSGSSGDNGGSHEEVERNMIRVRANHTFTSSMDIIH